MINNSDVMYKDDKVCILKPSVKKGVVIFSAYKNRKNIKICKVGLKSGKQLHSEGVNFDRNIHHPHIFFRAPFRYDGNIDYKSVDTEISSLYGKLDQDDKVFIRVDPNRTYVFSSEIRSRYLGNSNKIINEKLEKSKILLSKYLQIIRDNEENIYNARKYAQKIGTAYPHFYWNIFTYRVHKNNSYRYNSNNGIEVYNNSKRNQITVNIARNSEILVSLPHLEPRYFVKCN